LAISDIIEAVGATSPITMSKSVDLNGDSIDDFEYSITEVGGPGTNIVNVPPFNLEQDKPEVFLLDTNVSHISLSWSNDSSLLIPLQVNMLSRTAKGYDLLSQKTYLCGDPGLPSYATPSNGIAPSGNSDDGSTRTCSISLSGPDLLTSSLLSIVPILNPSENITVTLTAGPSSSIPLQGYKILASGLEGQSQRNITVLYMLPNLAKLFNNTVLTGSIGTN